MLNSRFPQIRSHLLVASAAADPIDVAVIAAYEQHFKQAYVVVVPFFSVLARARITSPAFLSVDCF